MVSNTGENSSPEQIKLMFRDKGLANGRDVYCPPGRAYAFVRFGSLEEAQQAMLHCQAIDFGGMGIELTTGRKRGGVLGDIGDDGKRRKFSPKQVMCKFMKSNKCSKGS